MEDAERERNGELIGPALGPVTAGQIEADLERGKSTASTIVFLSFFLAARSANPCFWTW